MSNELSFVSALQAILYLIGDDEQLFSAFKDNCKHEVEKISGHLAIDISEQHLRLLPSMLWSLMCLDLLNDQQHDLIHKSLSLIGNQMLESNHISFPGAVLLNQVINHLELQSLESGNNSLTEILTPDQKDHIQQLSFRYEQLELKENSQFTKKMFGVDVSNEVVRALKSKAYTSSQNDVDFQIERYNPQFNGYHLLANTSTSSQS